MDQPRALKPGTPLGGPGDAPGMFVKPRAIDSDGQHLVVVDRSGRVQVIHPDTARCLATWRMPETTLGFPTGIAVAPSPRSDGQLAVWIADTHYNRVLVYAMPRLPTDGSMNTVQPEVLLSFGTYGTGPGEFTYPCDVLVITGPDGRTIDRVMVAEFGGNDRVSEFAIKADPAAPGGMQAVFARSFGHAGDADDADAFQRPQSLAFRRGNGTEADELLVSDSVNHRVGRFTLEGALIGWLNPAGRPGKGAGEFAHPRGVLVLEDRTILVTEFGNNRVQHIDPSTGACLGLYGRAGRGVGELAEPWGIAAVGRRGFIVDAFNHRLVQMNLPARAQRVGGSGIVSTMAGGELTR